jgi:hypothetical protein
MLANLPGSQASQLIAPDFPLVEEPDAHGAHEKAADAFTNFPGAHASQRYVVLL